MLERSHAGHRPAAWWDFDAPERRNHREHETIQLLRLERISAAELQELKNIWQTYESTAVSLREMARDIHDEAAGERAYRERREWAGIPDWFPGVPESAAP